MRHAALIALALFVSGCATQDVGAGDPLAEMFSGVPAARSDRVAATLTAHPLGSAANPVRVHRPEGERAYLARLRCANGQGAQFERVGNTGLGPYGMIVDAYDVRCPDSSPATSVIHLDMYHPAHTETRAPSGFTIVP